MWEPYLKVIREKCSEALHILDRFHIVAKMNKALDEVRAGESRRMASEGRTPLLRKSRWLLLKREENLKAEQRFRLRDVLRYNLKTVRAYLLSSQADRRGARETRRPVACGGIRAFLGGGLAGGSACPTKSRPSTTRPQIDNLPHKNLTFRGGRRWGFACRAAGYNRVS